MHPSTPLKEVLRKAVHKSVKREYAANVPLGLTLLFSHHNDCLYDLPSSCPSDLDAALLSLQVSVYSV